MNSDMITIYIIRIMEQHIQQLNSLFGNLYGQLQGFMKQLELQRDVTMTGLELIQKRQSKIEVQLEEMQSYYVPKHVVSDKLGELGHNLDTRISQVRTELIQRVDNTHINTSKRIQEAEEQYMKHFQSLKAAQVAEVVAAPAFSEAQMEQSLQKIKQDVEERIQLTSLTVKQELTTMIEKGRHDNEASHQLIKTEIQQVKTDVTKSSQDLKILSELLDRNVSSLQSTFNGQLTEQSDLMNHGFRDIVDTINIIKSSLSLHKKEVDDVQDEIYDDFESFKGDIEEKVEGMKHQLRREMRLIEKPMFVL